MVSTAGFEPNAVFIMYLMMFFPIKLCADKLVNGAWVPPSNPPLCSNGVLCDELSVDELV